MAQYDAPRGAAVHIEHFVETGDRFALPPPAQLQRMAPNSGAGEGLVEDENNAAPARRQHAS
jgi:hypothetical protein